jgi:hypothetical protein
VNIHLHTDERHAAIFFSGILQLIQQTTPPCTADVGNLLHIEHETAPAQGELLFENLSDYGHSGGVDIAADF